MIRRDLNMTGAVAAHTNQSQSQTQTNDDNSTKSTRSIHRNHQLATKSFLNILYNSNRKNGWSKEQFWNEYPSRDYHPSMDITDNTNINMNENVTSNDTILNRNNNSSENAAVTPLLVGNNVGDVGTIVGVTDNSQNNGGDKLRDGTKTFPD